ncbi:hypothetical protein B1A87_008305 [Arthrobacter sp. KBS0703]|nr:hypothetical protein B1A87_008305 [Arthrobacter sp. KBS0703]
MIEGGQQQLHQYGNRGCEDKPDAHTDPAEIPLPCSACTAAGLGMGHHLHIDVSGPADNPGLRAAGRERGHPPAAGLADDDPGGADVRGELEERPGRIRCRDGVVAAAQLHDEPALGFEGLGRFAGDAAGGTDMDRDQLPLPGGTEDPGRAADQDLPLTSTGQANDNPFPCHDAILSPVRVHVAPRAGRRGPAAWRASHRR